MSDKATDLHADVLLLIIRRWRTIVLFSILGAAASVAYALLAPAWYKAVLTVVPSQHSQDSIAMSIASKLPIDLDSSSTDVMRIQAVIRSTSVTDEVIDKFELLKRYKTDHREYAREALWEHCATAVDKKAGLLELTCEDRDPTRAMEMTKYFGEVGNRVFGRVTVSSAREEREFLESQVTKARADVDDSSQKLREFQEAHKIVDLTEQSKAVISAMASIEGEMMSKQLDLAYLVKFSSPNESSVVQLKQQIDIMQTKLDQLESSSHTEIAIASGSGSANFFPGAMTVPELRFQLEQLMRTQKIQETVFLLMTQRFELSKVDEARDTSTFQILDNPTLPSVRDRPKRKRIVAMGVIVSWVLAGFVILVPIWWSSRNRARPVA